MRVPSTCALNTRALRRAVNSAKLAACAYRALDSLPENGVAKYSLSSDAAYTAAPS